MQKWFEGVSPPRVISLIPVGKETSNTQETRTRPQKNKEKAQQAKTSQGKK